MDQAISKIEQWRFQRSCANENDSDGNSGPETEGEETTLNCNHHIDDQHATVSSCSTQYMHSKEAVAKVIQFTLTADVLVLVAERFLYYICYLNIF
jgi:hypothetical protein